MNFSGEFASLDQIVCPSPEVGVTMVINQYRDDVGKIVKIAVDILPVLVTVVAGPTVGAISSVAVVGGKMGIDLYEYMKNAVASGVLIPHPNEMSEASSSSGVVMKAGNVVLGILGKMVHGEIMEHPDMPEMADIVGTGVQATRGMLKGKTQRVVEEVGAKGVKTLVSLSLKNIIPEVVLNLYEKGKPLTSTFFRTIDAIRKIVNLQHAVHDLSHVMEVDKAATAAISLLKQSSKKTDQRTKRAIKSIQQDAEQRKQGIREKGKKGFCTIL